MSDYIIQVDEFEFEENAAPLDAITVKDGVFHVLSGQKSYRAKVLAKDWSKKELTIEINDNPYQIKIADKYDQLVKKLGFESTSNQKANDVKAPMPGLVLEIEVKVGQEVKKGDGLLILEAMKMENAIKAAGDGIVKSINIEKGAAVDKGQLLIEME